jgi:hypothetical protein
MLTDTSICFMSINLLPISEKTVTKNRKINKSKQKKSLKNSKWGRDWSRIFGFLRDLNRVFLWCDRLFLDSAGSKEHNGGDSDSLNR